jgi:putative transposase
MSDRNGGIRMLLTVRGQVPRLKLIWADGSYRGQFIEWVRTLCGWFVEVVLRSDDAAGFQVLPKRWLVERTFAWLFNFRRLRYDYEYNPRNSEGMIYVAMIQIMARRLAKSPT